MGAASLCGCWPCTAAQPGPQPSSSLASAGEAAAGVRLPARLQHSCTLRLAVLQRRRREHLHDIRGQGHHHGCSARCRSGLLNRPAGAAAGPHAGYAFHAADGLPHSRVMTADACAPRRHGPHTRPCRERRWRGPGCQAGRWRCRGLAAGCRGPVSQGGSRYAGGLRSLHQ